MDDGTGPADGQGAHLNRCPHCVVDPDPLDMVRQMDKALALIASRLPSLCPRCWSEFVPGTRCCNDCGDALWDGPSAFVTLFEILDPAAVSEARMRAAKITGRPLSRSPPTVAPAEPATPVTPRATACSDPEAPDDRRDPSPSICEECGGSVDPETGACEDCLLGLVRASEKLDGDVEPQPADRERVEKLQRFLQDEDRTGALYCPLCLAEFAPGAASCNECRKPPMPSGEIEELLGRELEDRIRQWFVPVTDDTDTARFEYLLGLVDSAEDEDAAHLRICSKPVNFSAVFGHWSGYHRVLFVRRSHAKQLLGLLDTAEFDRPTGLDLAPLRERLLWIHEARYDDVWCDR